MVAVRTIQMTTEVSPLRRPTGVGDLPPIKLRLVKGWFSNGHVPDEAPFAIFTPYVQYQARQNNKVWTNVDYNQATAIEDWGARHQKLQDMLVEYDSLEEELSNPDTDPEKAVKLLGKKRRIGSSLRRIYTALRDESAALGL